MEVAEPPVPPHDTPVGTSLAIRTNVIPALVHEPELPRIVRRYGRVLPFRSAIGAPIICC